MNSKTVLISGAGIAGPTLAFWLRAAGLQPTLVEHAPTLRSSGFVIDFWGLGYEIAERMGLATEIGRIETSRTALDRSIFQPIIACWI
jgi:2-polyprenyl-6-methoxyphenol hydroxylase-like FAD-dependent oxidoreductase